MKNLENYGVLEMDAMEIRKIDGGFLLDAFSYAIGFAISSGESFLEGWNSVSC